MNHDSIQLIGQQIEGLLKILEINQPVKGEAAVFFDIDGTISRNDNLELLISEITNRNLLAYDKEKIVEESRSLWKSRDMDFKDYLKTVIDMLPNLKFFSRDILEKLAKDVIEGQGSHFYLLPWMFLTRLKTLGYKLIAISGAPCFMADMYLNKIGLFPWKVHSSEWIFENNVFSGKIDLSILMDKGKFIENTYKNVFNFTKCLALGDTASDISMLQKVGKAIAINPTYELAQKAIAEKWTVVLERKDLIVTFPDGQLKI